MDKEEEKKDLETEIKKDAEESEKKDKQEDKDYATDSAKDTKDREKFMKSDAERAEQDSREENRDYKKLDDLDKRYIGRDEFETRIKNMEDKYKEIESRFGSDKNDDYIIDLDKFKGDK